MRKAIRNLVTARESGKGEEKLAELDQIFRALKDLDLDVFVHGAVLQIPNVDLEILETDAAEVASSEPAKSAHEMVFRTSTVQEQIKELSSLFNPSEVEKSTSPKQSKKIKKKERDRKSSSVSTKEASEDSDSAPAEGSNDRSVEAESEYDSDPDAADFEEEASNSKMRKKSRQAAQSDSESEPEDVSALIGERPTKNRPGQRTRRKMILQKFGRNALVFQKERERKLQQQQEESGKKDAGSLHPSWAAKQRLKAAMSAAVKGGLSAAPKKVRLDSAAPAGKPANRSGRHLASCVPVLLPCSLIVYGLSCRGTQAIQSRQVPQRLGPASRALPLSTRRGKPSSSAQPRAVLLSP